MYRALYFTVKQDTSASLLSLHNLITKKLQRKIIFRYHKLTDGISFFFPLEGLAWPC